MSTFKNNYELKPAMVVLQWHSESVPGFLDVHQDQCGWRLLMIRQNVDPVTLGLVSREEADVIKHGHWFARSSLRKEFLESREGTPDGYMGAVNGMSAGNA